SSSPGARNARIIIFVGPPGAGKTSTLAKIAVRDGLAQRRSVRIISADPHRPAAHEKLRALAGLIGVGFSAASTIPELNEAITSATNKDLILIDTPGYSLSEFDDARDLICVLGKIAQKETQLVVPASMKREDSIRYIRAYSAFTPDFVLFT